jgi:hypothetical protein
LLGGAVAAATLLSVALSAAGCTWIAAVLASIGLALIVCLVGPSWVFAHRAAGRTSGVAVAQVVAALAVIVSVATTHWPLRITFALSRPWLADAASRVAAGEPLGTPARVGLFTIEKTENYWSPREGPVCLWMDLEPSGYTGFVRWAGDDGPCNPFWAVRLADEWWFVEQD